MCCTPLRTKDDRNDCPSPSLPTVVNLNEACGISAKTRNWRIPAERLSRARSALNAVSLFAVLRRGSNTRTPCLRKAVAVRRLNETHVVGKQCQTGD